MVRRGPHHSRASIRFARMRIPAGVISKRMLSDIEYDDLQFEEQPMCVDLSPTENVVAAGDISGYVHIVRYTPDGNQPLHRLKFLKDSCRDVKFDGSGRYLYSVSSDHSLNATDITTGGVVARDTAAHEAPINVLRVLNEVNLATGDDEGNVKIWDTRQRGCIRQFKENEDFVSDLLLGPDGKTLLVASGDGTLVVLDLAKGELEAASDPMEDEFLSMCLLKRGRRVVLGTQDGVLAVFHWGWWGDMKDRVPGHPSSVDAMLKLDEDTVLTGASDGLIRIVQLYPNKFLGVVGEHPEFPIERLAMGGGGRVLASCSHDCTVKLWDIGYLRDGAEVDAGGAAMDEDQDDTNDDDDDGSDEDSGDEDDDEDGAEEAGPAAAAAASGRRGRGRGAFYDDM